MADDWIPDVSKLYYVCEVVPWKNPVEASLVTYGLAELVGKHAEEWTYAHGMVSRIHSAVKRRYEDAPGDGSEAADLWVRLTMPYQLQKAHIRGRLGVKPVGFITTTANGYALGEVLDPFVLECLIAPEEINMPDQD